MTPIDTINAQINVILAGLRGSKKLEVKCECLPRPSWEEDDNFSDMSGATDSDNR